MAVQCKCLEFRPLPGYIHGELTLPMLRNESGVILTNTVVRLEAEFTSGDRWKVQTTTNAAGIATFSISEDQAARLHAEAFKISPCNMEFVVWYEYAADDEKPALVQNNQAELFPCLAVWFNPVDCQATPGNWTMKIETLIECTELIGCNCPKCT